MNSVLAAQRLIERTDQLLRRHPRRLTAAVMVMLMGSAVTAFGVAPRAPDAADLPRRVITESVMPEGMDSQLDALQTHALDLYRSELTRSGDTADTLLRRLGVDDPQAATFLRTDPVGRRLLDGRAGKMVRVQTTQGRLASLVARSPAAASDQLDSHFTRLTVLRVGQQLSARTEQAPLAAEVRLGSGTVQTSLFAAADDSRLPDAVTTQLAELFGTDIDFRRDLKRGDTFTVLYEALTADGEPVLWQQASGRLLAAQFINNGKTHDAVWFEDTASAGRPRGAYFSLDGRSKNRMFLASPMAFSRVTSGFAMRMHPILGKRIAHLGIDYGAPAGTPVRAVGEGSVAFAGWQSGYGNLVILRHGGERETRYAHLSRLNVKQGQRVEQGQTIGAVGSTGWATGPHLHFEFLSRGQQVDPVRIARESQPMTISAAARQRFTETASAARTQLATTPSRGRVGFE